MARLWIYRYASYTKTRILCAFIIQLCWNNQLSKTEAGIFSASFCLVKGIYMSISVPKEHLSRNFRWMDSCGFGEYQIHLEELRRNILNLELRPDASGTQPK